MQRIEQNNTYEQILECSYCGSTDTQLSTKIQYLAWLLPILALTQSRQNQCLNCHLSQDVGNTKLTFVETIRYLSKFAGTLFVIIAILVVNAYQTYKAQTEIAVLSSPQVFDIYLIDLNQLNFVDNNEYQYAIAKLTRVDSKQVTLKLSNYSYQNSKALVQDIRSDKLLLDNYFSNKEYQLVRKELLALGQSGAITKALRPQNLTLYGGLVISPRELNQLR